MAPLPAAFSDLEGHICCLKLFYFIYLWNAACIFTICLYMNRKSHVWLVIIISTKDFARSQQVSYTHCKCGIVSKTVPQRRCYYKLY